MRLLEKLRYVVDFSTKPHTRELQKPNEDRLLVDAERGIYIVLDGVTRVHSEYEAAPFSSAAGDVGDIFIGEVYSYLTSHISEPDTERLLRCAAESGNRLVREYREKRSDTEWGFYPSVVGIISVLRDGRLHYLAVGDCLGVLLRGNSKILFARELPLEAVDMLDVSKDERYEKYCNHPENHLSYTVFSGHDEVMEGVEYSYIDIHEGDVIFLATDGIGSYLKYEKAADLRRLCAEEIIAGSGEYDAPPYATYADDKTLVKLSFIGE